MPPWVYHGSAIAAGQMKDDGEKLVNLGTGVGLACAKTPQKTARRSQFGRRIAGGVVLARTSTILPAPPMPQAEVDNQWASQ